MTRPIIWRFTSPNKRSWNKGTPAFPQGRYIFNAESWKQFGNPQVEITVGGNATPTSTQTFTPPPGSLLVAVIGARFGAPGSSGSAVLPTISDDAGGVWTPAVVGYADFSIGSRVFVRRAPPGPPQAGPLIVTCDAPGQLNLRMVVFSIQGAAWLGNISQVVTDGAGVSSVNPVYSQTDSALLLVGFDNNSITTWTWPEDRVLDVYQNAANNVRLAVAFAGQGQPTSVIATGQAARDGVLYAIELIPEKLNGISDNTLLTSFNAATGTATSPTVTPPPGALLVAIASVKGAPPTLPVTVSDSLGGTWTLVKDYVFGTVAGSVYVQRVVNPAPMTFTVASGGATAARGAVYAVFGAAGFGNTSVVDGAVGALSGALTYSNKNSAALIFGVGNTTGPWTAVPPAYDVVTNINAQGIHNFISYQPDPSIVAVDATFNTGLDSFLLMIELLRDIQQRSGLGVSATGEVGGGETPTVKPVVIGVSSSGQAGSVSEVGTAAPVPVGVSATGSAGTVIPKVAPVVLGVGATGQVGTVIPTVARTPVGVSATGSAGTVIPTIAPAAVGVSATGSAGSVVLRVAPTIAGVSATGFAGSVSLVISAFPTPLGVAATGSAGTVLPTVLRPLVGVSATGFVGSVVPTVVRTPLGVSAAGFAGSVVPTVVRTPLGVSATGFAGSVSVVISAFPVPVGVSATGFVGSVVPTVVRAPLGVSATGSVGFVAIVEALTQIGVSATGQAGSVSLVVLKPLVGVSATGSAGTVSVSSISSIAITGVEATGAVGSVIASPVSFVNIVGVSATGQAGTVSYVISGAGLPAGVSAQGFAGTVSLALRYTVSGVSAFGQVGLVAPISIKIQPVVGVSALGQAGEVLVYAAIPAFSVTATGFAGSVRAGVSVGITGVSATGFAATITPAVLAELAGVSAVGEVGTLGFEISPRVSPIGVSAFGQVGALTLILIGQPSIDGVDVYGFATKYEMSGWPDMIVPLGLSGFSSRYKLTGWSDESLPQPMSGSVTKYELTGP